jgi:hypothetical protein
MEAVSILLTVKEDELHSESIPIYLLFLNILRFSFNVEVLSKKNIFGVFKLIFIQDLSCGSNISSWIYLLKSIFILNSFLSGKSLSNIF